METITKKPIQGAEIFTRKSHRNVYSDSLGFFTLYEISGGFFGCPSLEVLIKKVGYMEERVSISSGETKSIELKRRE